MLLMWRADGLKDITLAFKHRPLRKSTPISKPSYIKPPFLEQTWSPLIAKKKKKAKIRLRARSLDRTTQSRYPVERTTSFHVKTAKYPWLSS